MQPVLVRPLRDGGDGKEQLRDHRRRAALPGRRAGRPRRGAGAGARRLRRGRCRDGADREHPARGPQSARGGARPERLTDEFGMTHEAAARAVGRSRSTASNLLRLLNLGEPVQQMLLVGDLEMGHARALARARRRAADHRGERDRRAQAERARCRAPRRAPGCATRVATVRANGQKGRDLVRIEQQLSDLLSAAVQIRVKKRTGKGEVGEVAIAFASLDELNGLLARLGHDAQ